MEVKFSADAWAEYVYWQGLDKRTLKRINELLRDIARNGHHGIGKPEALKGDLSGYWSRRIDDRHRLVYRIDAEICEVIQCKGHYDEE